MKPLPLLLLPGLDGTARLFEPLLRSLPASIEGVPVAYPTDQPLGHAELAQLVRGLLPEGPFALLGESFSSAVALRLAAEKPPGLVGVVLTAGFVRGPIARPGLVLPFVRPALFRRPPPDFMIRRLLIGPDASADEVAWVREAIGSVKGEVVAARMRQVLTADAVDALRETRAPILHLTGGNDRMVAASITEGLSALCPSMEMITLDAPHLLLQRRPREAAAAIASFLERAAAR